MTAYYIIYFKNDDPEKTEYTDGPWHFIELCNERALYLRDECNSSIVTISKEVL